jgi:hypothetical protein
LRDEHHERRQVLIFAAQAVTVSAGMKGQHFRRFCSQRKEHPLAEMRYPLYTRF